MLRNFVVALVVLFCSLTSVSVHSQTPEITVTARSPQELARVLEAFGERGEMFGFSGPRAFLNSYSSLLDNDQPLTAALTFSTKSPMFAAELVTKDADAFFAALKQDGVQFDRQSGQLTKEGSSLRFFVQQSGSTLRLADNSDFLKNVRWPVADTFAASHVKAIARVDWRNLQPEMRSSVATQAMLVFLPQANGLTTFSLDALPEMLSLTAANRLAAMFTKSETMVFQFGFNDNGALQVTGDVINRTLVGRPVVQSPLAALDDSRTLATFQWNTPVEAELRSLAMAWAAQLSSATRQLFAGDEIEDTSGLKVIQEGAAILARHVTETIALPNLQGTISAVADGDRPIVVAGVRVAGAARLDGELQKLIKLAIEKGAPFQFAANVASGDDLSIHRVQLPIAPELTAAKDLFGETLTIHLATTSHALLISVGVGGEKVLERLIAPASASSNHWLDIHVSDTQKQLSTRLGLQPCQLLVQPSSQGFQVSATLSDTKGPTKLTSTESK